MTYRTSPVLLKKRIFEQLGEQFAISLYQIAQRELPKIPEIEVKVIRKKMTDAERARKYRVRNKDKVKQYELRRKPFKILQQRERYYRLLYEKTITNVSISIPPNSNEGTDISRGLDTV